MQSVFRPRLCLPGRMFLLAVCAAVAATWPEPACAANTSRLRSYDLPADAAERALKLFSQQSELGIIVGAEAVAGVRTNAVRGEMAAREALTRMLAGTGLTAAQDDRTGAFAVRLEDNRPNG